LVDSTLGYQRTMPIFRLKELSEQEVEARAVTFAEDFFGLYDDSQFRYNRRPNEGATDLVFHDDTLVRGFHASGALVAKRALKWREQPISGATDEETLIDAATQAVDKLGINKYVGQDEEVRFERLWRIKQRTVHRNGERDPVVLRNVVGAFRRYLHGAPVWGRASVYVELSGDKAVSAAGTDWRLHVEPAVDEADVIEPEVAVDWVLGELAARMPGDRLTERNYVPELFSLGYFSLPKRTVQLVTQPVYVAKFQARDRADFSQLIVVRATYERYGDVDHMLGSPVGSVNRS